MRPVSVRRVCSPLMVLVLVTLISVLTRHARATPIAAAAASNDAHNSEDFIQHLTRSRYCGRRLTETLMVLCQGRYPMMGHHRSDYADEPQPSVDFEETTQPENHKQGFPYSRSSAHRRVRRSGIYDECCKKSCSYNELRSYCE
ncbi:bombyxin A-1 homolog [Toxorhynchites rutilus septentrionalis]|uniref:bombyxin A-1 homolog n=1 Tax=Toxorhynchites rutilus septentrionalis TaxID=329112 RepID=UPI002479F52E|nr:bombyxin A-1 homolog [Toxorhynchites rutilus septentrionalis]